MWFEVKFLRKNNNKYNPHQPPIQQGNTQRQTTTGNTQRQTTRLFIWK